MKNQPEGKSYEWLDNGPMGPGRYIKKEIEDWLLENPAIWHSLPEWLMAAEKAIEHKLAAKDDV